MNSLRKANKLFAVFTSILMLVQPIIPVFPLITPQVFAQEATPTSTVEPTPEVTPMTEAPSPTPTEEVSPTPTEEVSPTPTIEVTPSVTPEATPSVTPTEAATPTPTIETNQPQQSNGEPPHETSPPQEQGEILDGAATEAPSPTVTPEPTEEGNLQAIVVQNVEANSLNLDNIDPSNSATLTTDKADYAPTDTAIISGTGFKVNHDYKITISSSDEPATSTTADIATDTDGTFVYAYQLDGIYRPNYKVEVANLGGHIIATTTFTDSATPGVDEYSQCSNDDGDGYSSGNLGCRWINGNLQQSNSTYYESDATPQLLAIQDLPTGDHTVTIKYGTTKGGKHAYDFITDDTFSETWITDADICDSSLGHLAGCSGLTPNLSSLIPTDPNAGGHDAAVSARHFKIRNGTWVSGGILSGPTVVSGSYAGDSETSIQLQFHVDASTCANAYTSGGDAVCEVVITWGAHVSSQLDWGVGTSSVNISGSPYHVSLVEFDGGSIGSRDNQMQASAIIPPSTITIHKATVPAGGTGFGFTTTGLTPSSFNLDDAGSQTFISVIPGTYTVTENNPSPYSLTGLTCGTVTGTGTSATPNVGTRSVSITIGAAGGGNVDCTFTNTLQNGHLIVQKTTLPSGSLTVFPISATGSGTIVGGSAGTVTDSTDHDYEVAAGTYSVTETVPAGWDETSNNCTGVVVAGGGTSYCQIVNTQRGHIIVDKVTDPSGDSQSFDFVATGSGYANFSLTDAANPNDQELVPGTYGISETVPSGWNLTNTVCVSSLQDTENIASLELDPNETITCTFTNTKRGHIIVDKITVPGGSSQSFDFVATGSGYANFALTDAANPNDQSVTPGVYGVSETVPTGWDLTQATCSDQSPVNAVSVQAGETVTCTFTNTQRGSISGFKYEDADGSNSTTDDRNVLSGWVIELWQWVTDAFVDTGLTDTTDTTGYFSFENVVPGIYQLREQLQAGWTKIFPVGGGIDVTLSAGEDDQNNNFANFENVSITVCKVADADGSNSTTDDRTPVAGWAIDLLKDGQTFDDAQVTAERTGCYTWTNLTPGSYSTSEETQTGWTNLNATSFDFGTVTSGSQNSHTFVNTHMGKIIVEKQTLPNGNVQNFDFTADYDGNGFVLADGQTNDSGYLMPGTYEVAETGETGWDLTSTVCTDQSSPDSISLQAGETVTCTFTNTQRGHLIVQKTTIPAADTNVFSILATGSGTITGGGSGTITDAADKNYEVTPGTYSVSETVPGNWDQTSNSCTDVVVAAGETQTCEIVNTKRGHVTVVKYHDHNANGVKDVGDEVLGDTGVGAEIEATRWEIHLVGTNVDSSQWTGAQVEGQVTFSDIAPGSYTLSESIKAGWSQSNISCADETAIDNDNSHTVSVTSGQTTTCQIGNFQPGHIIVDKVTLPSGSDESFSFTATGSGYSSFSLADGDDPNDQTVDPGIYGVSETVPEDWDQNSAVCTSSLQDTETANAMSIQSGETITCTFTNTQRSHIIVDKVTDPSEDDESFSFTATGSGYTNFALADLDEPNDQSLLPGTYEVSENTPSGWDLTSTSCVSSQEDEEVASELDLDAGETITCTFTNTKRGSLIVTKYNDRNDNGTQDEEEEVLADWTMNLKQGETTAQEITDANGEASFDDVLPGSYTLSEELTGGWKQTQLTCGERFDGDDSAEDDTGNPNSLSVTVSPGETQRCVVGNHQLDPILTISKSNDAAGDKAPGDSVIFTITVTATQSAAYHVLVTDLPAGGFTYRPGSWTANSTVRFDLKALLITPEPTYASPGTWDLGTMQDGEVVTLTYIADISGDQKPGLYKDLAIATGCTFDTNCEVGDGNDVVSNAVNPGFVDDTFVGTQVNIVKNTQNGSTLKPTTGEVLGASTELPATGANAIWLTLALILLSLGSVSTLAGWILRRNYV